MHIFIVILVSLFTIFNCSSENKKNEGFEIMVQNTLNDLQVIEGAKIFFGHQSVGLNIIDGIVDLMKEAGENNIKIIENNGESKLEGSFFAHSKVGQNGKPETKCKAFFYDVAKNFNGEIDIAFMKFCYVDITAKSDPEKVFNIYRSTIDSLKVLYPKLPIIHVTVPLRLVEKGWKAYLKKMLGKELGGYQDNIKRAEYNTLLKEYYKDDMIFDLAEVESTYPNGNRETFVVNNTTYYTMVPKYTYDSGHLNKLGRQIAAKHLLHTLSEVLK